MSELKAYTFSAMERIGLADYYLKSEADKVIAELKHQRDGAFGLTNLGLTLDDLTKMARKEIDRQKYKRCLAMASRCFSKSNYHFALFRHGEDVKENNRKSILYSMWRRRWLELAKQFKEEN